MLDLEDSKGQLLSVVRGAGRGAALGLGMALVIDAAAVGDATGRLHIGLPHPPLMPCMIFTLLLLIGLLELVREQQRLLRK
jgi:hypothetical protein